MKLKPGMVFEYVSRHPEIDNESELLIIINIFPFSLPSQRFIGKKLEAVLRERKKLVVYKVEDSRLHSISSNTLLEYYKPLYLQTAAEERREQREEKRNERYNPRYSNVGMPSMQFRKTDT